MSYVAEPYAQFVEDLLTSLTGGVARERFLYLPEDAPFKLAAPGPIVPTTLRVFGQLDGAFVRFVRDTDFTLMPDGTIQWKLGADGTPAAGASAPELGTPFYVNYDNTGPAGLAPLLSDRNPGSVVRLMSESFAREYAVLSRQLEAVYQAGFLDTATGRDLEQLVVLLGLTRRDRTFATGTVVFGRATPAPADVFVPAGTKLSTNQPPAVVFETTADATLHRGDLSVEVPIHADVSGAPGVVSTGVVTVIHRPILGVETVSNPQPTQLIGANETDDELRQRARRALETSGRATTGAIVGALATLTTNSADSAPVREKDILLQEDHINRPGVVTLSIAAELADDVAAQAVQLIEETRPVGVRIVHNLDVQSADVTSPPGAGIVLDDEEIPADATAVAGALFYPVKIVATVMPVSATLSNQARAALQAAAEDALTAAVAEAGIGEVVIYNRLVAAVMGLDGVLDMTLELFPVPSTDASSPSAPLGSPLSPPSSPPAPPPPPPRHLNLRPPKTLRPSVEAKNGGVLQVRVGGELITLDIAVSATLRNALAAGTSDDVADARLVISARLRDAIYTLSTIDPGTLMQAIGDANDFVVTSLSYNAVTFRDAGIVINGDSPPLTASPEEIFWINSVTLNPPVGP